MRAVFRHATSAVTAPPGTAVVPLALYDVLDCSPSSSDYIARVEPSAEGGRKIARAILGIVTPALVGSAAPPGPAPLGSVSGAPTSKALGGAEPDGQLKSRA